jgi:RHS repeat-associated protein
MMLTLRRIAFICWLAVVGFVVPVCADEPGPSAASANPNATYIVVLRESWQMPPRTDGEGRRPVEEPDFAGHGGELKAKWRTRRVVTLPPPAVEALQKHPSVLYLQRVNTGDPGDHPETLLSSVPAPRFVAATESVPAPVTSGTYQYDGAGNIIAIGNDVFTYDKVGRLISAVTRGVPSSYKYDVAGNQVESTIGTGATPRPRPVNVASNRLANVPYDRSGNQTRSEEGTLTYQYDPLNMTVGRTGGSTFDQRYIYTADDERLGINDLAEWDWTIRGLDGKVLSEFDSMSYSPVPTINDVWHWDQDYYHREGQLTASKRVDSSGSYRFYHLDHLGTPRLITDERGYRLSENAYYPFGLDQTPWNQEIENFSNRKIDNQKFTGHERDYIDSWHVWPQESLDYMHARFYSPASGRFLSVDPVLNSVIAIGEPQQWNRYSYVVNNPLKYTDPDGKDKLMAWLLGDAFRDVSTWGALKGALSPGPMLNAVNESRQEWAEDHQTATHGFSPVPTTKTDVAMMPVFMMLGPGGGAARTTLAEAKTLVGAWGKGTFSTLAKTIGYHFEKHGAEVGAKSTLQYLRKAYEFNRNLRGAEKVALENGATRYVKNGYYIIKDEAGRILSYGRATQ